MIRNGHNSFFWSLEDNDLSIPNTVLYDPDSNYIYVSTSYEIGPFGYYGGVFRGKLDTNTAILHKITNGLPEHQVKILTEINSKNQLFAAIPNNGLFRSDDRGISWQPKMNGLTDLSTRWIKTDRADNIFVCTYTSIFRSTDDGENWTTLDFSFISPPKSFAVDTLNNIYVDSYRQVYRSTDLGLTWEEFGEEFNSPINGIYINEFEYMFVYTHVGIYNSHTEITESTQGTFFRPAAYSLSELSKSIQSGNSNKIRGTQKLCTDIKDI